MSKEAIRKVQFIKNLKGSYTCKPFRKYNVVEAIYNDIFRCWIYTSEFNIHFIPEEYVKLYKH